MGTLCASYLYMLPAHIIEELRRREEHAREIEQERLRLPLPGTEVPAERVSDTQAEPEDESKVERGVWICDLMG